MSATQESAIDRAEDTVGQVAGNLKTADLLGTATGRMTSNGAVALADAADDAGMALVDDALLILGGQTNNAKRSPLCDYFGPLDPKCQESIAGLEYDERNVSSLELSGLTHVVGERFKSELRKAFIDWEAFVDAHQTNMTTDLLFDQVAQQLNIKGDAKDYMLELVARVYEMSEAEHIMCMMRQYRVMEPFSTALFGLFSLLAQHIEHTISAYYEARIEFLRGKKYEAIDDGTLEFPMQSEVPWEQVAQRATELDEQYSLESSSAVLLLINPPDTVPRLFDFLIPAEFSAAHAQSLALQKAVDAFHYEGFCPKRPVTRIRALLNFPLGELCGALLKINPAANLPDYERIAKLLAEHSMPKKPEIKEMAAREKPPAGLADNAAVIWYVEHIMQVRKGLSAAAQEYERYYIAAASDIIKITAQIKEILEEDE